MERTKPYSTKKRLEKLDRYLREPGPNSLESLAKAARVSQRTICRDLAILSKRYCMTITHRHGSGYHYDRPLPPPLSLVARGLVPLSKTPRGAPSNPLVSRILPVIHGAMHERRKIRVTLAVPGGAAEEIILHPHFIAHRPPNLILFAFRPDRRALVNIPISKIQEVEAMSRVFLDPEFSVHKIRDFEGWFKRGTLYSVALRFAPSATWAKDLILAQGQVVEQKNRHTVIRFRTDDLERVRRLTLFLGDLVTVEEPAVLRSLVRFHLLRMLKSYNRSPLGG